MVLDANIIIQYLTGDDVIRQAIIQWRKEERPLFLSAVVETEVLSFSQWTEQEQRDTEMFLQENFSPIPFDRPVARIAAEIRRGKKMKFPDAAIAATARFLNVPVVTRNQRDFKNIPNLDIIGL